MHKPQRRFLYNHFLRYILAIFPRLQYTEFGSAENPESMKDIRKYVGSLVVILLFVILAAVLAAYAPAKRMRNMAITATINGKIMVVTFSDSEEHIIQKIMDVLMVEPVMAHPLEKSLTSNILTSPNLEIRINEQTVYHDNHSVPLTHHEFFTLLYLAQHPSWVLSKEQIYEAVWKADPEQCGAAANVVYSLRWKIGDGYIETVVGSGYRFVG